mmetsp:Transcript_44362/g.100053  ORF Transcript_44362/g.100053 Transcript_44362/m.100053 type:complete len:127 (+) Transcript_44362:587-967(+)
MRYPPDPAQWWCPSTAGAWVFACDVSVRQSVDCAAEMLEPHTGASRLNQGQQLAAPPASARQALVMLSRVKKLARVEIFAVGSTMPLAFGSVCGGFLMVVIIPSGLFSGGCVQSCWWTREVQWCSS